MFRRLVIAALVVLVTCPGAALAQRDWSKIELKTAAIGRQIHMITGAGGNIGVFSGPDGVVVIDDQFAELSERLLAEIAKISAKPVRFVLNTHWHGDHVGGNENFAKAGATLIAQDNVRARMSVAYTNPVSGWASEPSPAAALPALTFSDSVSFHMNGQDVVCFHVPGAHTDGDVVVWFPKENVIHAGDVLFNGMYPVIDVGTGGSFAGMIAAQERIVKVINDSTKVIPGHGALATRADVLASHHMLVRVRDRVKQLLAQKMSLEDIVAARPLADLEATWGKGVVTTELILKTAVADLQRK